MKELVMILRPEDLEALGPIRCLSGLQAAEDASGIWLRGIPVAGAAMSIKQLPAIHTYSLDEENRLFPAGKSTPTDRLPVLTWQPLAVFIPVTLPVSLLPGHLAAAHFPGLVATTAMKQAGALVANLSAWKQYVEFAPLVRLKRLQFAVSRKGEALIMGYPLPPLPGKEYWLQDDLLIPAGFDFDPPMAAVLASEGLNSLKDGLLLFDEDGTWQRILEEYIQPASRSAVRRTKEGGTYG